MLGSHTLPLQGDQVKKGQVLAYVEQLGTFVEVKVGGCTPCMGNGRQGAGAAVSLPWDVRPAGVGGDQARAQGGVESARCSEGPPSANGGWVESCSYES